jgi:TonB family protein
VDVSNLDSGGDSLVVDASQFGNDNPSPDDFVAVEEMPVLITPPQPVYPEMARAAEVEGVVTIRALVTKEGKIGDAFVTEGHPMLNDAAIAAVKRAAFKPALQQHKPVAVWVQIPIRFSLH